MELVGVPKKMVNYTGDLYSMYVVLQGIGSLPCKSIRVYINIYHIRNSLWGVAPLDPWNGKVKNLYGNVKDL